MARGILAEVVVVGRLAGGHGHNLWGWRRGGGGGLCGVWCDVAEAPSIAGWVLVRT